MGPRATRKQGSASSEQEAESSKSGTTDDGTTDNQDTECRQQSVKPEQTAKRIMLSARNTYKRLKGGSDAVGTLRNAGVPVEGRPGDNGIAPEDGAAKKCRRLKRTLMSLLRPRGRL